MRIETVATRVEIKTPENRDTDGFLSLAYDFLKDMEAFPNYMENVLQVRITPKSENQSIVEWETRVEEAEFKWKQVNSYNESNRSIQFELIEGDFDLLEGEWKVIEGSQKIFLSLELRYAIGLPVIEDVLGPILNEKMESNSLSMLRSIKNRLETTYDSN